MELRPTNKLLWHVLSRLTPEIRNLILHSVEQGRSSGRHSKSRKEVKAQKARSSGKLLAWRPPRRAKGHPSSGRVRELRTRAADFEAERLAAPQRAEEILSLPLEQRADTVIGDERFQTLALAEYLLHKSRKLSFQRPLQGREVAELSLRIIQRLDAARYGSHVIQDLCGRAWSEVANSYRLSSDLEGAERALRKAEACVHNSADPLERARLCNLEAALRKDQRRFEEALRLRDRAIAIYSRFQDRHSLGRTLNSKGSDYLEMGRPEAAIECLQAAVESLNPAIEPRIALAAFHNLTLALAEQGRYIEAAEAYSKSQGLYSKADSDIQTKGEWVHGRIALGLGRLKEAEEVLQTVRREFRRRDIPYEYAAATLDLAFVCLRQGRTAEVKRLASEMMPIFKSRRIHREALAALTLFREAVERETVTVESLRKIIAKLERAPRKV